MRMVTRFIAVDNSLQTLKIIKFYGLTVRGNQCPRILDEFRYG